MWKIVVHIKEREYAEQLIREIVEYLASQYGIHWIFDGLEKEDEEE